MLKQYIGSYRTISIIGIAKNAGKTTVLNQLIEEYKDVTIGITSIGLDGEKIDNVTNKPKPRIKVYPKTIVATANDCLSECDFNFVIHEKTNIRTPLGEIMIVEAVSEGLALVAGPSTNKDMIRVINRIKKYACKKIFIDGALFRKSIASFRVAEACILATGASYSDDMEKVVKDTKIMVDQLGLKHIEHKEEINIIKFDRNSYIDDHGHIHTMTEKNLIGREHLLKKYITPNTRTIYLHGALNDRLVDVFIEKRHEITHLNVVVHDATHILASYDNIKKLQKTNVKLRVLNKLNLLVLTCNPVSPNGTVFDKAIFKEALIKKVTLPVINVLEDDENE